MAYTLQAFIGDQSTLEQKAASGLPFVPLPQGKALIPLTDDIRDNHGIPFLPLTDEGKEEIPASIESLADQFKGAIAYVEAEFFGGDGIQASAVWKEGKLIFGPLVDVSAINEALRRLGVTKGNHHDEFDSLGLGTYRDTNQWGSKSSRTS